MKLNYPRVNINPNHKVFVSFFIQNKRYRLYNGSRIGSNTNPNSFPLEQRKSIANLLAAEVYNYLINGGVLESYRNNEIISGKLTDKDYLSRALNTKLKGSYSNKYKKMLQGVYNAITIIMKGDDLTKKHLKTYLEKYSSGVSFNTIRRHLNVLINEAVQQGMGENLLTNIKSRKTNAKLHKHYQNIAKILQEIKTYNPNLYLCCLMTYGCLLRPHREIRELTWSDFSDDLKYINLSGNRNKSGRNRIVPVPSYVMEILVKGKPKDNIFSGKPQPLNQDYFKTLWSRFKRQSNLLEQGKHY